MLEHHSCRPGHYYQLLSLVPLFAEWIDCELVLIPISLCTNSTRHAHHCHLRTQQSFWRCRQLLSGSRRKQHRRASRIICIIAIAALANFMHTWKNTYAHIWVNVRPCSVATSEWPHSGYIYLANLMKANTACPRCPHSHPPNNTIQEMRLKCTNHKRNSPSLQ